MSTAQSSKEHPKHLEPPAESLKPTRQSKSRYATTKELWAIIPALLLLTFLVGLDKTIIATATPRITDTFHSLNHVGWYASSYLLTFGSFQLLFGRIYTFFHPKWVLISAIAIFEVGSALCGTASGSRALIVGRAVSGLGASGIFGGAMVVIVHTIPLHRRPTYQGIVGGVSGIASVVAPLLGGAFTSKVSWRWCFYINLPIGGLAVLLLVLVLDLEFPCKEALTWRQKAAKLDPLGTIALVPGIVCLLLALQWGGSTFSWGDWRIILLFILFGTLTLAFASIQLWKQDSATVPPRIVKNRSILSAMYYALVNGGVMIILVYYIPLWFQAIKGSSAVHSGIQNLAAILALVFGNTFTGPIITRVGYYAPFMIASTVIASFGTGMITTWGVGTGPGEWIGYQVLWGLGFGIGMQQSMLAVQASLERKDIATGIAMVVLCQTLGGAIFTSVAQNIFANKLIQNLGHLSNSDPTTVVQIGATEFRSAVSTQDLPLVLTAYNRAVVSAFRVALGLSCASIIGALTVEWKTIKKSKPAPAEDVEGKMAKAVDISKHDSENGSGVA
ncbi:putative efflux pump antibiotic resistance protein [Polyplosphaeria fusca]|uniref:Efflux pump antibiotic resistance protein n=1 Tax=Polyplosphaeria fusca TaxID=682080 RepID=A0A9P4QMD0_9PLEO|nr:putative efflux pump antibiotic resistance protein [Polyplosphaeria fusca]